MSDVAWVTGAKGFIGRHVARGLAARGYLVAGLGHGAWGPMEASGWGVAHWINGEISAGNLGKLAELTGLPVVIAHLAGGSSVGMAIQQPREDFVRTVASTAELLDWVRSFSLNTALIAASSAAVYGDGHDAPIGEEVAPRPLSPYGQHKLMMESLFRSYGMTYGVRSVLVRLFSVYGPGLTKQLLWDSCMKLRADDSVLKLGGSGQELRDWVYVEDVAQVLCGLAQLASTAAPVVNVGTGQGTAISQVASVLCRAWREVVPGAPIPVSFDGRTRAGDPFALVARVDALGRMGLECRHSVDTGVHEYVQWFDRYRKSFA